MNQEFQCENCHNDVVRHREFSSTNCGGPDAVHVDYHDPKTRFYKVSLTTTLSLRLSRENSQLTVRSAADGRWHQVNM